MEIIYKKVEDLIPYVNNTRTHSKEQVNQIASSIKEFGFTNPVLIDEENGIIAGHGRIMGAKLLKMKEVPTICLNGLSEAQRKAYIIADNKIALNAGWDEELLKLEIEALKDMDFDIDLLGFSDEELKDFDLDIEKEMAIESENPYSKKVQIPTYEPDGEKPTFQEMYEDGKVLKLIEKIESSSVDNEIKDFLKLSAYRHLKFNYEKIANYYAHSNKEIQELMEDSYLVIIDFNKAIEDGLINLEDEISKIYNEDNSND